MKRVTKRVRKVRSAEARAHLVYTSEQHRKDKEAADKLRGPEFVRVPETARPVAEPFPHANAMSAVCLFGDNNGKRGLSACKPAEYTARLAAAELDSSTWYTPTKKRKKNGEPILQKRKGCGLHDCYFSLPPWVVAHLAEVAEQGDKATILEARLVALRAVADAARLLEKRTGYKVVGAALHPDSRGAMGYHLQYCTASGGQLLGLSAKGKEGRKGLRLAGDVVGALQRMSAYTTELDSAERYWERPTADGRGYDDIALNKAVDQSLKAQLADVWPAVELRATEYTADWLRRRQEALNSREELEAVRTRVKALELALEAEQTDYASLLKEVADEALRAELAEIDLNRLKEKHEALTKDHEALTKDHEGLTTKHADIKLRFECATEAVETVLGGTSPVFKKIQTEHHRLKAKRLEQQQPLLRANTDNEPKR